MQTTFETRWWHRAGDKVVCTLCPRECHIPDGSRGFCFVRANVDGELVLTTYGRSSGFCVDPVEKKPLNHFLPGTPILSLGTAGCNLGCKFCQNWDISKSREMDTLAGQAGPEAIVQAAIQTGSRSIAFTYNDPVIWAEYAIDIAKAARQQGIRTVAVTAGYMSAEPRAEFYQWMDAANVDLKAFTETFYRKLTQTHLDPVLDTLKYLKHETDVWFEITNLMIPGENDSPDETKAMCDWIVEHLGPDVPIHFTAFHPDFKMLDKQRTPHETLVVARQIAIDAGIRYAYTGNVNDVDNQSTYCHGCGKRVIERDWYELGEYRLKGNRCAHCGTAIPGVFDDAGTSPGDWGRKRMPIRINDPRQYISITRSALDARLGDPEQQEMSTEPKSAKPQAALPQIDFDEHQVRTMFDCARACVEAAVRGEQTEAPLPPALDGAPAFGLFVTLRRGDRLRACRGRWGDEVGTLGALLRQVARDAALNDTRFPGITPLELPRLAIDLSVMHSPQTLATRGEAMLDQIVVGRHGLVMRHPRGAGLLLPHVARENRWDAATFLDQLCAKAGLPVSTWRTDQSYQVMTFETRLLVQEAPQAELDVTKLSASQMQAMIEYAGKLLERDDADDSTCDSQSTTPRDEALGIHLQTATGQTGTALGSRQSLTALIRLAARSLRDLLKQKNIEHDTVQRMVILWQAVRLRAEDYPQRHGYVAQNAVLAEGPSAWALRFPTGNTSAAGDHVGEALKAASIDLAHWRQAQQQGQPKPRLTAFAMRVHDATQRAGVAGTRPAARAGQFYPADTRKMAAEVERFLAVDGGQAERRSRRAIMLPHAGWVYCGQTIGKTLARADVPDRVIILGPKHTPYGANFSVAPHDHWQLPGGDVPIATDIVQTLLDAIPGLRCEADAHRMEHGCEVLLPFLRQVNAKVRVVPVALGACGYDDAARIGVALGAVARQFGAMLVISSDMNHFAPEAENRRRDMLALNAMRSGDPRALYDTCMSHDISMCGMLPAVTVMNALGRTTPTLIDYTTSAQTSGDSSRVVGYAGVVID